MIVAYRDGVMAADSGTYVDGAMIRLTKRIVQLPGGTLTAAIGGVSACHRFTKWMEEPSEKRSDLFEAGDPSFEAILVSPLEQLFSVDPFGIAIPIEAPFVAIGSGWKLAFGAMAAGASAERAVEIAIEFHDGCHAPIQTARLNDHA